MLLQPLQAPWAESAEWTDQLDVGQRPLLLAEPTVRAVRAREQRIELPQVGKRIVDGTEWPLFELSATGRKCGGEETVEIELDNGGRFVRQQLHLHSGLDFGQSDQFVDDATAEESTGGGVFRFLGRHVELVYGTAEAPREFIGGLAGLDLSHFVDEWGLLEKGEDARHALIVALADQVGSLFVETLERPRQVLRRRRSMERASSVRQIDPAGIRWLSRQPGRSLAERAGPRQRLLAVVRDESLDTLENRVLVDMLERSLLEARHWLFDNKSANKQGARWKAVRRLDSAVRRLRRVGPLAGVRRVQGVVEPNYVLQHDPRYSRLWTWYQKLCRRQEQEDQMCRWAHRTFSEAVVLALVWAVEDLEADTCGVDGPVYERSLLLRREQDYGQFVDDRSQFSGWVLEGRDRALGVTVLKTNELFDFERRFRTGTALHEVVPDAVVVGHHPFQPGSNLRFLLVWSRLHFNEAGDRAGLRSVADAVVLRRGNLQVDVVIVEPSEGGIGRSEVECLTVPATTGATVDVFRMRSPLQVAKTRSAWGGVLRDSVLSAVVR